MEKNIVNFGAAEIDTNCISAIVWKAADEKAKTPIHVMVILNGASINLIGDSYTKFVAWHAQNPAKQIELPSVPVPAPAAVVPLPASPMPSPATPPAPIPPAPGVPTQSPPPKPTA